MCKKVILVTGASGFLGQNFIRSLDSVKYKVIAVSRKRIEFNNVESITADISKKGVIVSILENYMPDYIFNFCVTYSKNFDDAYFINTVLPKTILNYVGGHNLTARVVLMGSAAEYGYLNDLGTPANERECLQPYTTYGLTKSMQALFVPYYKELGVNLVYARLFNLYGEGINKNLLPGLLNEKIKEVLVGKREKIDLFPLGDFYDYISVHEAIRQIKIVASQGEAGEIYNIGSGKPILVRNFVKNQLQQLHLNYENIVVEKPETPDYRQKTIYACMNKFNTLLEATEL